MRKSFIFEKEKQDEDDIPLPRRHDVHPAGKGGPISLLKGEAFFSEVRGGVIYFC